MLAHLTWQQYLLTVGTAGILYYLALLLLYYREEARRLLTGKKLRTDLQAAPPSPPQVSIMGAAITEAAPLLSDAAAIRVAPAIPSQPGDAVLQDILQEVKPLLEMARTSGAGKEDFCALLGLALARYPPLATPGHQEALRLFLLGQHKGKLPFELTPADLRALWPDAS